MTQPVSSSRNAAFFTALYAANPDPWNFATSTYERKKYQATISSLQGRHFEARSKSAARLVF